MAFDWLFLGSVQKKVVETIVVCLTAFFGKYVGIRFITVLACQCLDTAFFSVWTPPCVGNYLNIFELDS